MNRRNFLTVVGDGIVWNLSLVLRMRFRLHLSGVQIGEIGLVRICFCPHLILAHSALISGKLDLNVLRVAPCFG